MKLRHLTLAVLSLALGQAASAATLTEDFEGRFPAWESGWFGTQSNARNYYCFGALNCTNRGNNPDGLWLSDTNGGATSPISVSFNSVFGASLTSLYLDVANFTNSTLTAYDMNNNLIFSQQVAANGGAFTDPGSYTGYTITSANGISRFEFSGAAKGNLSVDNLVATTSDNGVPEPTPLMLVLAGVLAAGAARRSRRA